MGLFDSIESTFSTLFGGESSESKKQRGAYEQRKQEIDRQIRELGFASMDEFGKAYGPQYHRTEQTEKMNTLVKGETSTDYLTALELAIKANKKDIEARKSKAALYKEVPTLNAQGSIGSALAINPNLQINLGAGTKK